MEIEQMSEEIFYSYLAGLMDSDGCFCLPMSLRKTVRGSEWISIRPMLRIGWADYTKDALIRIQKKIGAGKIYVSNKGTNYAVIYWQTTNWEDTVNVCKKILPYMFIKKKQCESVIRIGERFITENSRCRKFKPKDLMLDMAQTSCTLNPEIRQTKRYRDYKNFEYWKQTIERLYSTQPNNTIGGN